MGKSSVRKTILTCISLVTMSFMVALVPLTLSLFIKQAESDGFYGEVSLRSYFDSGDGTSEDTAFVITRPRHMYNLSRLQGLGVFDTKTYFRLGLVDDDGNPYCYLDDTSSIRIPYLDMSSENSRYDFQPVNAIGSEAMPFYGEFDGQGLEIKDLNVYADPEDAGLFGYTAHGSKIKNLFLDNITIHATGYTPEYAELYGEPAENEDDPFDDSEFTYIVGDDDSTATTFGRTQVSKFERIYFDATSVFNWNGSGTAPTVSTPAPIISYNPPEDLGYKYKLLISGDFLKEIEEDEEEGEGQSQEEDEDKKDVVGVDLFEVFDFFRQKKAVANIGFPIEASSSVSFVASMTDSYGLDHSKVVMTLDFHFSLNAKDSNTVTMVCRIGKEHGNNIGLIVGHCDGSISDCYVHDGEFVMNDGNIVDESGATYSSLANGSNYGLIGLVGGTVHNIAAQESGSGTGAGKDIGVLDFTTVYEDIINDNNGYSFNNGTGHESNVNGYGTSNNGIIYKPSNSITYREYLRKDNGGNYVTYAVNTVSFNSQKVIASPDLGIFTIATNQTGTGMNEEAGDSTLPNSMVSKEATSINSNQIYYTTGEYQKDGGISFSEYRDSFKSDNPTEFHPGYHFPHINQVTSGSFEQRNKHQNYIIRFKMDVQLNDQGRKERASGKGFYLSDVDEETTGGYFMSRYFENILVDQNSEPIPSNDENGRDGVMLKTVLGDEIERLTCSFATPDMSYSSSTTEQNKPKRFCVKNTEFGNPAANSVNFEIKTKMANVTVVAGLADINSPAALGVYRIDNTGRTVYNASLSYINDREYDNPDYAFFMPTDNQLAYFDYKVDENNVGHIGVYKTTGSASDASDTWEEATSSTDATVPKEYGLSREHGFATGKTRLYAHTFKLPEGRYCLGSATGLNRGGGEGLAKIYYLCAQGQTDGQLTYEDNAFTEENTVQNVDFTKKARYTLVSVDEENETANVATNYYINGDDDYETVTTYNANNPYLECQRCYVSLANNDRSLFDEYLCNLKFAYVGGKFVLSTNSGNESRILRLVVNSYATSYGITNHITGLTNNTVHVINKPDSTGNTIIYTPST